jgi:hypothetical protein
MDDNRYPVGKFVFDKDVTPEKRKACIRDIAVLPANLRRVLEGLSNAQMDTPYRDGGWTVRQVAHHLADSHMNAFVRCKLALTENAPTIKPYDQDAWAQTADVLKADTGLSLSLLEGMHARWTLLLNAMTPADFARTFMHPERGPMTLDQTLQTYAWHCRHHVAQIHSQRKRMGW